MYVLWTIVILYLNMCIKHSALVNSVHKRVCRSVGKIKFTPIYLEHFQTEEAAPDIKSSNSSF